MRKNTRPMVQANLSLLTAWALACAAGGGATSRSTPGLVGHWTCDQTRGTVFADTSGLGNDGTLRGGPLFADGVTGQSLRLDGIDDIVEVPDAECFGFADGSFSLSAWVNVYALGIGQQMILGKNVYSSNQREWSLLIDDDSRPTLYLRHKGWTTAKARTVPEPGRWYHIASCVDRGRARIYVNGVQEGEAVVQTPIPDTAAPLSIGGQLNAGRPMQFFYGAIDDVRVFNRALTQQEVSSMVVPVSQRHTIPEEAVPRFELWAPGVPVPLAAETPLLEGVEFVVVEKRQPEVDGWDWLHGAALIRHRGALFTSWGRNKGKENTVSEVNHGRRSQDGGRTWTEVEVIGPGVIEHGEAVEAHSHGVFLSHDGELWALLARFGRGEGRFRGLCMDAFVLDEATDRWQSRGVVGQGIWPLREPEKMADGNWLIPGCDEEWRAAVAISHGDDLTAWDTVKIPVGKRIYTEATCWVDGSEVTLVMRNHSPWRPGPSFAAVSVSTDFGRTWSPPVESNLPMTTSKPYAGVLSTGQRYLLCTTVRDHGNHRWPLTVAVGRPGEKKLCRMWRIRDARRPGAGDTVNKNLAYPHAVELDGKLYVIYSSGTGGNLNDCELAIIPLEALAAE